jgi:type II secretory pathway component PulF
MDSESLDDITALNEQLVALAEAGVPLDVELGDAERPAAKALERIRATVVRRVNRGETLAEALEGDDQDVPASYRSLLQMGIHSGNISAALDSSSRVAESIDDSRFTLESAFVYPLIVGSLAYLGLVGFCLFLVPVLHGMYESAHRTPGPALRVLQSFRDTLPYWVAIPPVLLLIVLVAWKRGKSRRGATGLQPSGLLGWLPGARRTLFQERCARFAASLRALIDAGLPFDDALRIAGDASGDSDLRTGSALLAADAACGAMPSDSSPKALLFPPFLRWAIWHAEETTGRSRALEIAARLYREAAEHRAERLRTLAPILAILFLGGSVTLLYGLALFMPFVELLRSLAY